MPIPPWFARITLMALVSLVALAGVAGPQRAAANLDLRFGVHAPPAPIENLDALRAFEESIGYEADTLSIYQGWGNGGWAAVQPEWLERASGDGARDIMITWEPWVAGGAYSQPDYHLTTITNGLHDTYITQWARDLAAWGRPIHLRPMHEMNGHWYPWAGGIAGNTPERYIAAWRRMHRIFAREGADNVRWVFSPMAYDDEPAGLRFEQFYPGHRYVDVLALDGYNWGTREAGWGGWRSFDAIFRSAYQRIERLGPQPIWIAEVGSATEGGDKADWVRQMFRQASSARYPRLESVIWFNIDKERDWRATSSTGVARTFGAELARIARLRTRLRNEFRRNSRSADEVVRTHRALGPRSSRPRFRSLFESVRPG